MKKILFVTIERPHRIHLEFAESVCNEFYIHPRGLRGVVKSILDALVDKKTVDVIFVQDGRSLFYAYLKKLKSPNIKIVLLNAEPLFYKLYYKKFNFLKRLVFTSLISKVDAIITVSNQWKKYIREFFDGPIYVVHTYGVNVHFDIQCDLNSNKILFIGNKDPIKRADIIVDALKIINSKREKPLELYLVGMIDYIKEEFPWLHKEGYQSDLSWYFKNCSLYVHPADYDSCPLSVWEAMSAGLIPILSKNVGSAEVLEENDLDFLVSKKNTPEAIADKILKIYNKPLEWKKEISQKCKEISGKFNKENQVKKFKEAFFRIIKGKLFKL